MGYLKPNLLKLVRKVGSQVQSIILMVVDEPMVVLAVVVVNQMIT